MIQVELSPCAVSSDFLFEAKKCCTFILQITTINFFKKASQGWEQMEGTSSSGHCLVFTESKGDGSLLSLSSEVSLVAASTGVFT